MVMVHVAEIGVAMLRSGGEEGNDWEGGGFDGCSRIHTYIHTHSHTYIYINCEVHEGIPCAAEELK